MKLKTQQTLLSSETSRGNSIRTSNTSSNQLTPGSKHLQYHKLAFFQLFLQFSTSVETGKHLKYVAADSVGYFVLDLKDL